jgi:hypothetical protein
MQEYEQLKQLVMEAADDVAKAEGGNKAAAQEVRKRILEGREGESGSGSGAEAGAGAEE